jgi:hypothetical protein
MRQRRTARTEGEMMAFDMVIYDMMLLQDRCRCRSTSKYLARAIGPFMRVPKRQTSFDLVV